MRYVLQHPHETRPSLLVEVVARISEGTLNRMREAMLDLGCAHGLVIDDTKVHVLRDTFRDLTWDSIEEDAVLETTRLLGNSGELVTRVQLWLDGMSNNWSEVLPREDWAAPLFYDVVPAIAGADVRRIEPSAA